MIFNAENGAEHLIAADRSAPRGADSGGAKVPQLKPTVYRPSPGPQLQPMQCC